MFSSLRRRTPTNLSSLPLAHLLMSNDPPSDVEENLVRNMIQAMWGEITAIKLEIDIDPSHPGRATTLEDRKATIIRKVHAHESILSPLRKLPTELLQVIFRKTYWDPSPRTTFTLPWSLSQVCRLWRTVVQSTPILWSCITLNFDTNPMRLPSQVARLQLVLQRSSNANLRVSVCGLLKQGDRRISLLSALVAHSERWEYLNLDLTLTTETITVLQAVKGHLQRLSQLHLTFGKLKQPMLIDIFSIAPRLEVVVIDNILNAFELNVPLPLPQLRSYVYKTFEYGRGEEYTPLDAFSNLEYLETRWERTSGPLEPPITFARLRSLVILFSNPNSADGFFERLILPSIREIHVWGCHGGGVRSLSSTILRSLPCNLHTLSINATNLENSGDLTSLLRLTPQLVGLRIPLPPLLDLSNLIATPEKSVLLPRLRHLSIAVPDLFPPSFSSTLAALIKTRCEISFNTRVLFPEGFRTLRALKLKFTTRHACRLGYNAVQPLPPVGDLDSEVLALITSWKTRLVEEIPRLSSRPTPQKMLINVMHWRRLDQLFNTIEGYDVPKSGYLHASKLHFVMYALDQRGTSLIPGEKRYHFRSRAKALLDRWEPLLLQDVHHYQWLTTDTDPKSLLYVHKRAELRRSAVTAIDLIYSHANMQEFYR